MPNLRRARRAVVMVLIVVAVAAAGCSGRDESTGGDVAALLEALPQPRTVNEDRDRSCERFGYTCPEDATAAEREIAHDALGRVADAMAEIDDPYEQLRAGLDALSDIDGIGNVSADVDGGSLLEFTVDDGPAVGVLTNAAAVQELDGEVPSVDDGFEPEPGEPGPVGIRSGPLVAPAGPTRYEPVGGALNQRSALIINPYDWDVGDVTSIFAAEDEYTTVDVLTRSDVNPIRLMEAASYDAVHVFSHGGGGPSGSVFMGGEIADGFIDDFNALDVNPGIDWFDCQGVLPVIDVNYGPVRFCFRSTGFPLNPDGIAFFNVCGSGAAVGDDGGFAGAAVGAGSTVTWSSTADTRVARRTAVAFWNLMVTDGVEFELAQELIKGRGLDSHGDLFLTKAPRETVAKFSGANRRARDVIDVRIDGADMAGQIVYLDGTIADDNPETFPAKDQEMTVELDGVRLGTEAGVQFQVLGDGKEWKADIDLLRDGTVIEEKDGYGTWRVTLRPGAVEVPDRTFAQLTDQLTEIEVRAFETRGEYTADVGEVRLGMDVVAHGPLPHLQQLESQAAAAGGSIEGNDLAVSFNTGGGDVTGELHMTMTASGVRLIAWDMSLAGTYDPASGTMTGTAQGRSQSYSLPAEDGGFGDFTGQVNKADGTVTIAFEGTPFTYTGTV